MRFLLVVYVLCSTFGVAVFPSATQSSPQCAPFAPPAISGPLIQPSATSGVVLINEVMPRSQRSWDCSEIGTGKQNHNMWIELYNPQGQPLNLYPIGRFDSGPGTNLSYFPVGAAIPAHGFLVIFPENSILFASGATFLRLLFIDVVIDQVNLSPMPDVEQSYARVPDGSPDWQVATTPTIAASNNPVVNTPTPSPAPKHTPTRTSSRQNVGNKSTTKGSSATTNTVVKPSVKAMGTQPAWNNLQLPPGADHTVSTKEAASSATIDTNQPAPPATTSDPVDLARKVLFTSLAIALAAILFLWWRRFKPT